MSRFTNIFDAAKEGTIEDVRFFVERQDIDVNAKEKESGNTPVLYAAGWNRNADVLQYLVSKGGKVNVENSVDNTPLYFAARCNSVEVLQILVSNGANVNAKANLDSTPLHGAADYNSDVEVLKYLISQGADVKAKDYENNTPFDVANTKEKKRILREAGGANEAGAKKELVIMTVGGVIGAIIGISEGGFIGFLIGAYLGVGIGPFMIAVKEQLVVEWHAFKWQLDAGNLSFSSILVFTLLVTLFWTVPKMGIKLIICPIIAIYRYCRTMM